MASGEDKWLLNNQKEEEEIPLESIKYLIENANPFSRHQVVHLLNQYFRNWIKLQEELDKTDPMINEFLKLQ